VLLVIAILREANLLVLVVGLLSGPILLGWGLAIRTLRMLEVERRVPRSVGAGDLLVVRVRVTNRRRRLSSWAVIVEDRLQPEGAAGGNTAVRSRTFFGHIPSGETRQRTYRGRMTQRGRYRLGPLEVQTRFPFGFFSRTVVAGGTETVTILPRLGRLRPGWTARRSEAFEGSHRPQLRQTRGLGDFYGVREWRPGESRRWIHWRSSARHDTLVVCQLEQHREFDVAVLLDLWQPRRPGVADRENVELAVSFTATVVAEVCRQGGSSLSLGIAGAEPYCLSGPVSTPLLQEAMERLAVAQPSWEDHLAKLLDRIGPQLGANTDVILVTTRRIRIDHERLQAADGQAWWKQPLVARFRVVDTSDARLAEYFETDWPVAVWAED